MDNISSRLATTQLVGWQVTAGREIPRARGTLQVYRECYGYSIRKGRSCCVVYIVVFLGNSTSGHQTGFRWPCLSRRVGRDDIQRSLPSFSVIPDFVITVG